MAAWTISARSAARPASRRVSSSTSEPSSPTSSLSPARASLRSWPLSGTPGSGPGGAPAPYLAISASVTGVSPADASRRACRAAPICCLERRPRLRADRRCLARLRRSAHPGDQEHHETGFPAHIWNAAWIGGQRFFPAATGHSAVVDLDLTSKVSRTAWTGSPQPCPAGVLAASGDTIITATPAGNGIRATIYRTYLTTRVSDLIAELTLNDTGTPAATTNRQAILLADARGNELTPHPILTQLTGALSA